MMVLGLSFEVVMVARPAKLEKTGTSLLSHPAQTESNRKEYN